MSRTVLPLRSGRRSAESSSRSRSADFSSRLDRSGGHGSAGGGGGHDPPRVRRALGAARLPCRALRRGSSAGPSLTLVSGTDAVPYCPFGGRGVTPARNDLLVVGAA